jgi:hypothetical protein
VRAGAAFPFRYGDDAGKPKKINHHEKKGLLKFPLAKPILLLGAVPWYAWWLILPNRCDPAGKPVPSGG